MNEWANRWVWRWTGAAAAGVVLATACSAPGASLESAPEVGLVTVGTPLREPVWSYHRHTLVALTDDHRLAEITGTDRGDAAQTRLSAPLHAGRNIQVSQRDDRQVFVPQPQRGRVAVVDLDTLRPVDEFDAGPAPAYLAEDAGERMLLALSEDGSSVTPVDEYGYRRLPTAQVCGDSTSTIHGANRGRAIEYHVYGPSTIGYYKADSSPPDERGTFDMDVAAAAGDGAKVTRSYVAARNRNELYAVDSGRDEHGLRLVGRANVSSPIRYLGTDDTRVYAATDREVAVFETASFTGYRHDIIPMLRVIDYRSVLPTGPVQSAALSGMAIGPHRVYLTLQGQPTVISVAKPRL